MATKNEMIESILKSTDEHTKSNLSKMNKSEVEDVYNKLKEDITSEKSIDPMEEMKAQLMAELKEQLLKEAKEEAEREVKQKLQQELEQNKPKKKKEIDRLEPIPVMNVTNGQLIYLSRKTGSEWIWGEYGDVQYIEFDELRTIKSSARKFIDEPHFVILDEDVVNYFGLSDKYHKLGDLSSLDNIFNKTYKDFVSFIETAPKGIQYSVVTKAREKFEDGSLDSNKIVKFLNEKFNTDIGQRG